MVPVLVARRRTHALTHVNQSATLCSAKGSRILGDPGFDVMCPECDADAAMTCLPRFIASRVTIDMPANYRQINTLAAASYI
jgi:hypothetical protein